MADTWELSFRVGTTQDKDTRYAEVYSSVFIPDSCLADVQAAHDSVWSGFATEGEPAKPYAVYMSGWRDESAGTSDYTTNVVLNA